MTLENHVQGLINVDGDGIATVRRSPILTMMAMEVESCNREKGWYEVNPAVEEFMEGLVRGGFINDGSGAYNVISDMAVRAFGGRTVGDDLALLTSEVSEALEAYREHGLDDQTKEPGAKPEGFGSEAADILIRLLDLCNRRGIDLFEEWRRKMDFNWTRPHRHGDKRL